MKSEIINIPIKCRPLITTAYPSVDASYLQLPYEYQLKDIRLLERYLCPGVKVVGVDFNQKPEPMPKLKYKTVCIEGINVESKQKIKFNGKAGYRNYQWVVDIAVQLPLNSEEIKHQILRNLTIFSVENGSQVPFNNAEISQKQMIGSRIYCMTSFTKKQSKDREKRKVFMNKIPVGILLPNEESYRKQNILEIIAEDLAKSITILNHNQLQYRAIGRHKQLVPIQNFYKNVNDKDQDFLNFVADQKSQQLPITQVPSHLQNAQKANKNLTIYILLVSVLLFVMGGYVFIKFT